jgi:hypothetical protein
MKIVVKDDCEEFHYKFIFKFKHELEHIRRNEGRYQLLFMYKHGRPLMYCDMTDYDVYFRNHELYENAIQYLIDNNKNNRYEIINYIDKTLLDEDYDIFCGSECYRAYYCESYIFKLKDYKDCRKEEKEEYVNKLYSVDKDINDGGDIINNLDDFIKLICYAPSRPYNECGKCFGGARLLTLRVDIRWDIDNNDRDPSICQKCYDNLDENAKINYKFPEEDYDKIREIAGNYFFFG